MNTFIKPVALLTLFLISSCFNSNKKSTKVFVNVDSIFKADSGYIDNYTSKKLLNEVEFSFINDSILNNDTSIQIKYYSDKMNKSIACCLSYFHNESLVFYMIDIQSGLIPKTEVFDYHHGNWNCCTNKFGNFLKHNQFYSFEGCSTGSGLCSKYLYFFKKPSEICEDAKVIVSAEYNWDYHKELKSDVIIKDDSVKLFYHYIQTEDNPKSSIDVKFQTFGLYKNRRFKIMDSTNFAKYFLDKPW